ncbi:Low conductance mechanosensitive channel YnaI [Massilia sp. Bi118]|uniref:mechanosensitive ion channel family protein n=1 Tax=Massilia sp. Bi118 TaxID=2822346 RepID=UPI001E00DA39|nr:mechanosensitive ion channel family protein [Massilia sp. Bi118]CAH0199445.1 Low conductance mechanosensitive channel YnaI [Massilia sp. Bi118]
MHHVFFGNTVYQWLSALGVALVVMLSLWLIKHVLVRRLGVIAARTATRLDDVAVAALESTKLLVMAVIGLYAGSLMLVLPEGVRVIVTRTAITIGLVQGAIWGNAALRSWLQQYYENRATDPARATSAAAVGFIARMVLWVVILLMILDNLGVNITTLVASLGIGGIAVALAVQNILGDLFASLSIVLDKPFVIGDFIVVDKYLGTVEYVGLKTTRIRSLGGEQLVFSNADLLKSRLQNMSRLETRRAAFTVSVTYDTPAATLRAIPAMLAEIVKAQPKTRLDRSHFTGVGASSMNFEVVYFYESPDYLAFMDVQQEIWLRIVERFDAEGIEYAYPTQTLQVRNGAKEIPGITPDAGGAPAAS